MRSILLLSLALLSLAASAQQIYKWTDDKGVTHYSENPPPNVKATKAGIRAVNPAAPVDPAQAATKAQEDKLKAQRQAACRGGLAQLMAAQGKPQVYVTNDKGERVFTTDATTVARTQAAQKQMRKNCDPS
jgi:Domain of unknown function (DUF4124)